MYIIIFTRTNFHNSLSDHMEQEKLCRERLSAAGFSTDTAVVLRDPTVQLPFKMTSPAVDALRHYVISQQAQVVAAATAHHLGSHTEETQALLRLMRSNGVHGLFEFELDVNDDLN